MVTAIDRKSKALTMTSTDPSKQRAIKSFAIRSGRMTAAQREGLQTHLQKWGLSTSEGLINCAQVFNNDHPTVLEIGFGMGDSLASMAAAEPKKNFMGVEVHSPGIGRLLSLVASQELHNVRVFDGDAVEILKNNIAPQSLSRVNIYFPDPWHKTKHHKRRLIQPEFLSLLHSRLSLGGLLHIATDWQHYANQVLKLLDEQPQFENIGNQHGCVDAIDFGRPETKFERRGKRLGHGVWDMAFRTTN